MKRTLHTAVLVAVAACVCGHAIAQTTTASLVGVVHTEEGDPVPDAAVLARDEATGAVRNAITDGEGRYRFDGLFPGTWTIVARPGNGDASRSESITLALQETGNLDLVVGEGLTETVTVKAKRSLIEPERTSGEVRLGTEQVQSLPLSGREFTDLAFTDSSIQATSAGSYYGERNSVFVLNGQSGRANSFLVDGLDNNDYVSNTSLNASFSLQDVREFVVLKHQYAPEFGGAAGGVLNIVTRKGSNEIGGSVFLQGASDRWNRVGEYLEPAEAVLGQAEPSQLSAGFRLSGPFRRDKAFYYLGYEHREADEVLPYWGINGNTEAFASFTVAPVRRDNLFLRTDFNLDESNFLMVRLSASDNAVEGLNVNGITSPEAGSRLDERDYQLAASLTSVVSPSLMLETRLLVGTSSFDQLANSDEPGVTRPTMITGGNALNRQVRDEDRLEIVQNATLRRGPHLMKFGMDVTRSQTGIDARFNPSGQFLYETNAPFEPGDRQELLQSCFSSNPDIREQQEREGVHCNGDPDGIDNDGDGVVDELGVLDTYPVAYSLVTGAPAATLDETRMALFVQDSWRVSSTLLLDYGVRYDLSTYRLPEGLAVPSPVPNGNAGRDWNNFAPRFAFTYAPNPGGKFVLRGGAGVYYDKLVLAFPAVASITSGTTIGLLFPQGLTFEFTEEDRDLIELIKENPEALFDEDRLNMRFSTGTELETPYVNRFNIGAEWGLGERGSIEANVVRAQGYHHVLMRDLNPVLVEDGKAVTELGTGLPIHVHDPTGGYIASFVTEGRTWYTGLELDWKFQGARTWYSASYTWSKSLDMGPDPLRGGIALPPDSDNLAGEKGPTDTDVRHRFVLSADTPLPWLGLRISGVLQLATGIPFNVTTGEDTNLDGIASERPEGVGRNSGENTPLGPVNEFRTKFGFAPVTSLKQPSFAQLDVRLSKPFFFNERKGRGEMFVQVFNVFDRFNGGPVDGNLKSPLFGRPIGELGPPRTFEFGMVVGY